MNKSGFRKSIKKYHSPSNSSLVIILSNENLECVSTEERITFNLTVMFAANQQDSASVTVQILVWYARDDGEVVSDARDISIMECLLNSVNIEWSTDEALPGANVSLSVTAEPLSLCSLGVVDKSVELLTPKKYLLTIKRLLNLVQKASVKSYDYQQVNDFEYCQNQQTDGGLLSNPETTPPSTISSTSSSTSTTSSSTSSSTSSTTSTPCKRKKREAVPSNVKSENLRRSKRSLIGGPVFPLYYSDDVDALHMCDEAGSSFDYDYYYFSYNYYNDYYYYYYGDNHDYGHYGGLLGGIDGGNPGGGPEGLEGDGDEDEEETDEIRTYFPETWLWSLFSVSSDGSYEEDLIVPDTVTEWVGRAVCVHPSKGVGVSNPATFKTFKEFFVDLTLPPSVKRGEIFHVKISVFNYLNDSLPIWLILKSPDDKFDILADTGSEGGSGVKTACVPANDKTVVSIRIQAREVGDVNISVKAEVMENATDSCGSGNVQQKRDILIKPIRVNFEGFLVEETQFKFVCTNDSENVLETWNVTAPDSIVPDSARGFAAVVGDLLGPTVENLGNLVQMPYGCGEQNMINFAPNIFVVQYLRASNQDDEDIADRAIEFMKQGYQRELNYRHSDGSFSVFGESDASGSTWLTAFVLKCFGQASAYIAVDQNDLNLTSEWLKSLQNDDGCFESVGRLFNKAMQGGVDSESPSLLTAYVMISLIEAGESNNSTVISEALSCINDAETTTNPYSLAIKAYALALAKSPDTQAILDELMNISTNSDVGLYWEFPNQYESSNGVAVETASYAVLAILTYTQSFSDYSYMKHVLPIIKWINTQRNGQGGFVSTQDTIIALQALAAFQKLLSVSGGPTDLTAVLRYNVQEGEINEAFSLNVTTTTEPGATCETKRIKVCTAYILPDKSNMAIIEIDVVSGYIPERADLDELVGNGTGLFKRKEIDVSKVKIYVEEITAEEICLSFRIRKGPDVENPKPGTVKVYDYYKPENQASKG
ncbi:Alpha-2-macroglobulin-like protein 1, partial [Armadillidium nasatum]